MWYLFSFILPTNRAATEKLTKAIVCNESQLKGGCQTQLTDQFSAEIALSN